MIYHEMDKKKCSTCGTFKSIYDFHYANKRKGYLQTVCKKCNKESNKKCYNKNLDKNRAKRKDWQEKNRELHNKHQRAYYARKRAEKREGESWGLF